MSEVEKRMQEFKTANINSVQDAEDKLCLYQVCDKMNIFAMDVGVFINISYSVCYFYRKLCHRLRVLRKH